MAFSQGPEARTVGTRSLEARFPLAEGEVLLASLNAYYLDEQGAVQGELTSLVTNFALRLTLDQPYLVALEQIEGLGADVGLIQLALEGGDGLVIGTETAEEAQAFFSVLLEARRDHLGRAAQTTMAEAVNELLRGNAANAALGFAEAAKQDGFNGAPSFLAFLLNTYLGLGSLAADNLVDALLTSSGRYVQLWLGIVPLARFGKTHLYRLLEGANLNAPLDQLEVAQLLLGALVAYRQAGADAASPYLSRAVQALSEEAIASMTVLDYGGSFLPISALPGLGRMVLSQVDKRLAINPEEDERRVLVVLRDYYRVCCREPFDAVAVARLGVDEVFPVMGSQAVAQECQRVLEDWRPIVDAPAVEVPAQEQAARMATAAGIPELFEWIAGRFSNRRAGELAWACLRAGEVDRAASLVGKDPVAWYRRFAGGYHPSVVDIWLAALVAAEVLAYQGKRERAVQLLAEAYQGSAASRADHSDPYAAHAGEIYGLYSAICLRDVPRCRLYLQLLSGRQGFRWARQPVLALLPEALRPATAPAVSTGDLASRFGTWLAQTIQTRGWGREPACQERRLFPRGDRR